MAMTNAEKCKRYQIKHRDRYLQQQSEYYQRNKQKRNESKKQYRKTNLEWYKKIQFIYRSRLRERLFHMLGHVCISCGAYDKRLLQFDHINNTGYNDRKRFGRSPHRFFMYYIRHPDEAKQEIQVMCISCNWLKRYHSNTT